MLSSTINDLPGYQGTSVLGEVFSLTARSGHVGSPFGAALESLAGGERKGMTKSETCTYGTAVVTEPTG